MRYSTDNHYYEKFEDGTIKCAGTYAWKTIKVLEDNMEVVYLNK